jgi:hypothetical protein
MHVKFSERGKGWQKIRKGDTYPPRWREWGSCRMWTLTSLVMMTRRESALWVVQRSSADSSFSNLCPSSHPSTRMNEVLILWEGQGVRGVCEWEWDEKGVSLSSTTHAWWSVCKRLERVWSLLMLGQLFTYKCAWCRVIYRGERGTREWGEESARERRYLHIPSIIPRRTNHKCTQGTHKVEQEVHLYLARLLHPLHTFLWSLAL